ncbi:MAG: hypothetical protein LBC86_07225 [Oscillospiraceae bacterium]|nr:hypothetical protein [Oscillospiraceae bacterium]
MNSKKHLHGNRARIKPDKNIIPRFTNFVSIGHTTRDGTVYYQTDEQVELAKKEVNDITKL